MTLHVSDSTSVHHQVLLTVHTAMVYPHTLITPCFQHIRNKSCNEWLLLVLSICSVHVSRTQVPLNTFPQKLILQQVQYSYNKTKDMHSFLKFIFGIDLYMFHTAFLSIIRSLVLYTQQQVYVIQVMLNACQWDQDRTS